MQQRTWRTFRKIGSGYSRNLKVGLIQPIVLEKLGILFILFFFLPRLCYFGGIWVPFLFLPDDV